MATEPKASVLVVDDEIPVRELLSSILRDDNYEVVSAASVDEAVQAFEGRDFDVVFTDLTMPKRSGLELLAYMKENNSAAAGIVLTGYGSQETAIQAMRLGAFDYLTKPFSVKIILDAAARAIRSKPPTGESIEAPLPVARAPYKDTERKLVGKSAPMRVLQALIDQVAPTASTVLIRGESGTGKELVARALHRLSPRANQPMIPVNCGAIPEDLLESELFGHVKGSFTGAIHDRVGRFVLANKGTIFLDEIGDMSPKLQVKVLRVLQEQELEPVGSTQTIRVDVRVVAATNVNLELAVEEKRFREDLYYRLNVVPIELPPLRERLDDLPLLIQHFIKTSGKRQGRVIEGMAPETLRLLEQARWPGNVRELENLVERMCILSKTSIVMPDDLPPKFRHASEQHPLVPQTPTFLSASEPARSVVSAAAPSDSSVSIEERFFFRSGGEDLPEGKATIPAASGIAPDIGDGVNLDTLVDNFERQLVVQALEKTRGVKSRAAEMLGIKRTTLVEKMKKKNIVY
ncbi:TPA: DNA-binding response regulator [Candidatus Sumerlaeota bacterium]|jgi:DNA-binding NtrC family response regulator|nr:DNA-binding response regulator [Candidatus Sumerlaeota bacterium]